MVLIPHCDSIDPPPNPKLRKMGRLFFPHILTHMHEMIANTDILPPMRRVEFLINEYPLSSHLGDLVKILGQSDYLLNIYIIFSSDLIRNFGQR